VEEAEPARQVVLPAQVELARGFRQTYAPGESVAVDLTWYPLNKIDTYYSASVRVIDGKGNKVKNVDREPALQTMFWSPGVAVPDRFELELPPSLAPGAYSVQLLMYQANQGLEALLLDRDYVPRETTTLATFMVK
jgi:hypothetical protein